MTIDVRQAEGDAIITPQGKFLGSVRGPEFRDALDSLRRSGVKNVVVDLSRTDFMDSTAVGVLISGLTTMRRDGGEIRLAGLETRIKNLFVMTHLLGPVFEAHPTAENAIRSFHPKAEA
jgi:anti-sigma B factor antagonist